MGVDKGLRRARIQEGDTAELHGNGAAVDHDNRGEGRVISFYCTGKTRPLLGKQGRVLSGVDGGHRSKDVTAVVRRKIW